MKNDFNNIEKDRKNLEYMPDAKNYIRLISFIKSGIRILGYGLYYITCQLQ